MGFIRAGGHDAINLHHTGQKVAEILHFTTCKHVK